MILLIWFSSKVCKCLRSTASPLCMKMQNIDHQVLSYPACNIKQLKLVLSTRRRLKNWRSDGNATCNTSDDSVAIISYSLLLGPLNSLVAWSFPYFFKCFLCWLDFFVCRPGWGHMMNTEAFFKKRWLMTTIQFWYHIIFYESPICVIVTLCS